MKSEKSTETYPPTSTDGASRAKPGPGGKKAAAADAGTPEEIRAGIERTREHMDESLASLSRKLRPLRPENLKVPLLAAAALGVGLAVFRIVRRKRHPNPAKRELRWRSTNLLDQVLLMKTLAMAVKKGKPAIFVVKPDR